MLQYFIRRLLYGVLVLLGVVVIVFWLFNGLGDPARLTLGQRADVATIEAVNKELGLDKPRSVQFIMYLNDVLPISIHENTPQNKEKYGYLTLFGTGSKVLVLKAPYLRRSYQTKRPVTSMLLEALPKTVILALTAMLFASVVGIVLGVFAAVRQFSWADNVILVGSVLGISQPSYFSGIILALIFGYWLGDYTGLNYTGGLYEINDLGEEVLHLKNLILPALALGIRPVSIIMQLTRSSMLDVLSQDYIRTAQAKGLGRMKIIFKHALRNALNPVITAISGWLAGLLAGAYFIEIIFDYKGLGYVTINALNNLDFPVAMGAVLFTASLFVVINLLVDMIYGILDPRVSYQH
ncbi:ABC transporter permease [Sphingobacteriales bacterium UPWRP_1]|nr:ABC transporter permease [Sphingobacteriales bacterium UPWRP_1]